MIGLDPQSSLTGESRALQTVGRTECIGYTFPLCYRLWQGFPPIGPGDDRFKIIILEKGAVMVEDDRGVFGFHGPSLVLASHKTQLRVVQEEQATGWTIYFHPEMINAALQFDQLDISHHQDPFTLQDFFLIESFLKRGDDYRGWLSIMGLAATRVSELFGRLADNLDRQADGWWPCRSRSCLLELILFIDGLYRNRQAWLPAIPSAPASLHGPKAAEILVYLHAHFSQRITMGDLTRRFAINRNLVNELLRQTSGKTLVPYLTELRLNLAAGILRETGLPIPEILDRVGFADTSNFSRLFKARFSCSPSHYRATYGALSRQYLETMQ